MVLHFNYKTTHSSSVIQRRNSLSGEVHSKILTNSHLEFIMKKVAILLSLIVSVNAQIGDVTTFAGSGTAGAVDGIGTAASLNYPPSLVTTADGTLYVSDYGNNLIRKISTEGVVTTFAGTGNAESIDGVGLSAAFNQPAFLIIDGNNNLFLSEWEGHKIRKITPDGTVTTFAGSGNAGVADGVGTAAKFYKPAGMAFDNDGNLYVSDAGNNRIRKISPEGVVSTFYVNAEELGSPRGITFDKDGNLFVANTFKHVISKIDQNGTLTTFAGTGEEGYLDGEKSTAMFNGPVTIKILDNGDMLISDRYNHVIRKISNGIVTTFAGKGGVSGFVNGIGVRARFNNPYGMVFGQNNEIYLADFSNHSIRKIKEVVYTPQVLKVPSVYSTIQAAIDEANKSDTVLVADGTYTENLSIDKDIKIISENGAEKTIIDGGKITHVIGFGSSTTRDCVLDGFTVTNGGGDDAGGILVSGGFPILRNLIITGNRNEKYSGGGIDVVGEGANPVIEDCIITDNYATDSGGGLMVAQKATATIKDVTISNNTAGGNGGGINVWEGSIKIKNAILENNSAKYQMAMSVGTGDTLDFRPIIDIENVEVINQRDSTINELVSFSECSLTVKNLSFSNIRTESNVGSFYNSYMNIENLSLKDIRDNGHSLLFIGSKGTVSGLTIERDTSRWAIAKIDQGSKIDFNNLKMSNCTTTDHAGLFITSNPTASIVNIDTLDINNCNWKSHSISVDNSIFTLDNGKISNITAQEGSAGLNAWSCNSIDVSNTIIDSSYSGSNGGMIFYQVKKVNIKNSSFIANRSGEGGGGIHVNEVDSLFIDNCSFLSDSSDASGTLDLGNGKFYSLKGLIMENNYAADAAGAINLWGNEKVEIIDSKFISNKSVTNAGAIYSWNTDSLFIDNSIFNGNESTDGNGGAMYFIGDEDSPLYHEIKNTTFENNSSNESGAIAALAPIDMNIDSVFATGNEVSINGGFISLCCGASVSINHSTINNNIAKDNGGAINGHDGSLDILNSNFSNNECGNQGGAIRYRNGPLNIFNSSFKYNKSIEGNTGAVDFAKNDDSQISNLTITQSDFIGNTSNRFVGALRAKRADSTWIKHTVFDSNEVETWGGAAEIGSSKYLEIDSSTITNNMANGNAAGLTVGDIGEGIIKNSIFANNIMKDADADTSFGGGLTLWGDANIKSINNTFVGNKAYKASAIGVRDSSNLELVNTIIWDNPGTTQLGLYIDGTLTAKNSVIGDGKASIDMDDMSKITSYDDQTMIETNPLLCDFWSGSWPQLAGNYHLTYLSPAIGKGENGVNMGAFDVGCDIDTALLSVDELIDVTPTVSALHENYPNPFNPTTTLRFDLPEVSSITLTIYNMLGQRVRTFNMNDTPAGYHSIKWNATNDYGDPVGAGVYLYQLRANQYVKTRKMVLLK